MKQYFVYIMASTTGTLYIGITNDLRRRVHEHKNKLIPGFTSKYNVDRLVYYEQTQDVRAAIAYEKTLKGWLRSRKLELIQHANPTWRDLNDDLDTTPC